MTRPLIEILLCACPLIVAYGHTNHNHSPHSHSPHVHTPHTHTPHTHLSPPPPPPPPPPSPGLPIVASTASTVTYQVSGGSFSDPFFTFLPALASSFEQGVVYTFQNAGVTSPHRFRVGTARDATPSWVTGTTDGLHASNIGSTISMTIPSDHTGTVTYYCNPHSAMTKAVSVTAAAGDTPSPPQPSPPPPSPSPPPLNSWVLGAPGETCLGTCASMTQMERPACTLYEHHLAVNLFLGKDNIGDAQQAFESYVQNAINGIPSFTCSTVSGAWTNQTPSFNADDNACLVVLHQDHTDGNFISEDLLQCDMVTEERVRRMCWCTTAALPPSGLPSPPSAPATAEGLSTGAIIGISVGAGAGALLVAGLIAYFGFGVGVGGSGAGGAAAASAYAGVAGHAVVTGPDFRFKL